MAIGSATKRKFLLYTELEKLVEAGFGIREAASAILENQKGALERGILKSVLAGLKEGKGIAASFAGPMVGEMELAVLSAGERGGRLGMAFGHLADYFGMMARARQDALRAMIYPLILLHLGLLLSVIPSDVMSGGIAAEGMVGRLLKALLVTYGGIAVVWMLVTALRRMAVTNAAIDRLINLIPVVGRVRRNLSMARFTKVYHAGLMAGLSMSETATMAGNAAQSGAMRDASRRLARTAEEGDALGPVLVDEGVFPKAFAKSYATAEASGTLDKDLQRWSKVYEEDARGSVKTMSIVVPKLGYVLIVAFVVWKLVSFYSGYYGSLEELGI